jgi:uridine kinase
VRNWTFPTGMKPHLIGIAGPSSSGKSELARALVERLPGSAVVSLDSYYRRMTEIPLDERRKCNFDDPAALEWELLHTHLEAMAAGRAFDEPVYSFPEHTRLPETRRIEPTPFILVEGLFVLYWPELRAMLRTKVYVETPLDVCFERRLKRDVAERGRTPESVYRQYAATVRPGAERFVLPTRAHADLVVSGEEPLERTSAEVLESLRLAAAATAR